jgi:hypothetical protein
MYDRICHFSQLIDLEKIKTEYQEILQSASLVRSLAIKFDIRRKNGKTDISIKDRIIKGATHLLNKESQVLEKFMNIVAKI